MIFIIFLENINALYFRGFFCQLLLPNHIQKTYIYKHKTHKIYTIQTNIQLYKRLGVCVYMSVMSVMLHNLMIWNSKNLSARTN